jgi:hypothetical protein
MRWMHRPPCRRLYLQHACGTWRGADHGGPPARPRRPPVTAASAGGLTRGRRHCAPGGVRRRDWTGRGPAATSGQGKVPGLAPLRREIIGPSGD